MRTIGVYLVFAAVVLRTVVVVSMRPEFPIVIVLLAGYGLLLSARTWLMLRKPSRTLQFSKEQVAYLFLQSILIVGAMIFSSYEDFLALLFIPLSLDAVSFFGRRAGYQSIAIFSLTLVMTLLFSYVGWLFGLVMGILYSGICFLMGGYAYQVQNAQTARDQNEQMFHELQTAHRQLQGYADQLENLAVEQERNRLARELHDSVTQTVFSMNLAAQSAQLLLGREPQRVVGQLLRIEELAVSALREIQALVSHLSPHSLVQEGFPTALRRLALEQDMRSGLRVLLEIQGERTLSQAVTTSLYSIVQEALINVAKHSGTCEAVVRWYIDRDHSCLEIEDHGRGFDPQTASDQRGHLGLAGMRERAREIGWSLAVHSQPGLGTRILVTEPASGAPK